MALKDPCWSLGVQEKKLFMLTHPIDVRLLMNAIHTKGKIESKCPAQITAWLKSCLEVMPVEKIKITPMKKKQQIGNRSPNLE